MNLDRPPADRLLWDHQRRLLVPDSLRAGRVSGTKTIHPTSINTQQLRLHPPRRQNLHHLPKQARLPRLYARL